MQLYQIVDSVVVGRYLGKEALAAVGASTPVIMAVVALVMGIGAGASVVISQYFGAKQTDKVKLASDTLHIFMLGAGTLVALIGLFLSEVIFRALDLPEELIPQAAVFLRIYLSGSIMLFGFNVVMAMLRAIGDSRTPLYLLLMSAVLNVGLDLLFVLVFKWGIAGAAWATVISQGAVYFSAVWYVNRTSQIFKIKYRTMKFDTKIFKQCVNYGLPTGIQQAFVALGGVALMGIVNQWGTDVIAGYTAAMRVDNLAMLPAMNIAMALTSFTGQNVGAGKLDRVREGLRKTLLFSSGVCIVLSGLIILFGDDMLRLFSTDARVIEVGKEYLVIVSSFYLLFSTMFVINGLLRGAGAVWIPMISTLASLWIVRVPLAWMLSKSVGEVGIWWSIPIGWALGLLISFIYYKTGKWKNHSIFAKEEKLNAASAAD